MTVSLTVRPWLLIITVGAGAVACAGLETPASPPAQPSTQAEVAPPPTSPENPSSAPKVSAPPAEVAPEVESLAEVAEILARKRVRWRREDTRMGVARRGAVRLHTDGPDHGLADGEPFAKYRELTVVENAERPRVVVDQEGVRLLFFVDRADAQPVVLTRAPLAPAAQFKFRDPPRRGHVVLLPGTWVDELQRKDGAVSVRLDRKKARKGWIDPAALGTSFVGGQDADKAAEKNDAEEPLPALVTKRRTTLLTRPGGRALVTIGTDEAVLPLTGRATQGHRLVEYNKPCDDEIAYVGFVAGRDLYQPNMGSMIGCGTGWGSPALSWGDAESAPRVEIDSGRFLLDPDQPVVVGCVVKAAELADLGDGLYAVATLWGPIPVRLAPDSVQGACGTAAK